MFAIGLGLFAFWALIAMMVGDSAPEALKLWGGSFILIGIGLMAASLLAWLWRVLP